MHPTEYKGHPLSVAWITVSLVFPVGKHKNEVTLSLLHIT